jgi:hypothetical protein
MRTKHEKLRNHLKRAEQYLKILLTVSMHCKKSRTVICNKFEKFISDMNFM